jgi:hypothetical protein
MSGPDGIDERFGTLMGELRSGEATASPELRDRVRAIATRRPEPPAVIRWRRLPRRVTLVLVPACALIAAAVGVGVFTSGGSQKAIELHGQAAQLVLPHNRGVPGKLAGSGQVVPHAHSLPVRSAKYADKAPAPGLNAYSNSLQRTLSPLPPSGSRPQNYAVDLTLRVSDLSGTTKQAINLTRGWGGYVVSVDSGSDRKSGTAYLELRIPIVKIQSALARLSGLGTILANHVSIQDVQVQLNKRYSRMQALRVKIASLRGKLTDPNLTQSQKDFFNAQIAERQGLIDNLQQLQQAQETKASFATVGLDLETKKAAAAAPPGKQGQIGRALHNIGRVLVVEAEVLLYVLLIGAPFAVLAALLWFSRRGLRRRSEEQLLAR